MKTRVWQFKVFGDKKGKLFAIEWDSLPFKPKRIYVLRDVKGMRGAHAHMKEKEVFVCIGGSFRARIHDGAKWKTIMMNKTGMALFTNSRVWHEFDKFSRSGAMLAISSTPYKGQKEYITDFKEFLKICGKKSS